MKRALYVVLALACLAALAGPAHGQGFGYGSNFRFRSQFYRAPVQTFTQPYVQQFVQPQCYQQPCVQPIVAQPYAYPQQLVQPCVQPIVSYPFRSSYGLGLGFKQGYGYGAQRVIVPVRQYGSGQRIIFRR